MRRHMAPARLEKIRNWSKKTGRNAYLLGMRQIYRGKRFVRARYVIPLLATYRGFSQDAKWAMGIAFAVGLLGQMALGALSHLPHQIATWLRARDNPNHPAVSVVMAELQSLSDVFSLFTTLQPMREALLRPPGQVVVGDVLVRIGDPVKRGQVLVRFRSDSENLRGELEKIDMVRKEMDIELTLALSKKNFVSGRELKQTELDQKANRIRRQLSDLESTTVMRSPIDGVVAELNLSQGDYIDSVQNYGVRVIQPTGFRVQAYVPNQVAQRLSSGAKAYLALVEGGSARLDAQVTAVGSTIDPKTGSVFIEVTAPQATEGWKVGSVVEMGLVLETSETAITVPSGSLVWKSGAPYVFRFAEVDSAPSGSGGMVGRVPASAHAETEAEAPAEVGKVEMVAVKLGIRNDSVTEIREGIDGGDRIVVRGQTNLVPGTTVQLVE